MSSSIAPDIKEFNWDQARSKVAPLNPEFAEIIDRISPDDKHTLYEVEYKFGDNMLDKNAEFILPTTKGFCKISDESLPKKIRGKLNYNLGSNPIAITLKNSLELFIPTDSRVIPFGIIKPGKPFGLWRILDGERSFCPRNFSWGLTAGARSLFMLAKITEEKRHTRLKNNFDFLIDKPKSLTEHHEIFKAIANHSSFGEPWSAKILFFSKEWFEHTDDPAWIEMNYYLLKNTWQGSSYWRNQFLWNIIYSSLQKERNLKPSPYIVDIVKHLLAIATSALPGFQTSLNDDLGPISRIQQAYQDVYQLKYPSTIMQPGYFSIQNESPFTYYSLQYPTSLEMHLKSNSKTTALTDLYSVKSLLDKYFEEMYRNNTMLDKTISFYDLAKKVIFDAFHPSAKNSAYIENSEQLILHDLDLSNNHSADIPKNVNFFNGCIRISKNRS